MELQSLGYVGLRARNLEDWVKFGVGFLDALAPGTCPWWDATRKAAG